MLTKSCTSNGGTGCSRGFVREKCQKCNLGSIACDMCHAGSLANQHYHHHHQQLQQQQQQQQSEQQKRRGSKENNTRYQHLHHRLSSSSSVSSSSSSRSSSACSTPTIDSPRNSLSIEASAFPLTSQTTPVIAGCAPLATTTMTKILQRAGSGSGSTGNTPSSTVNSALVPVPSPQQSSSFSAGGPQSLSSVPSPPALPHSQISSPRPKMTIKTLSISYRLPLPSGHPQKSLLTSSPVSPTPSKDISLAVITDYPYLSYTRSAPSSPTTNITGLPSFTTFRPSSTSSPPPFLPSHPSLLISSSIPAPSSSTTTAPSSNSQPTSLPPPSSSYSVPSSPSPYGPSSLPCIFCFNGRKSCEECFGLGYVQRICQECLRDRHRQQSNNNRRRMKHTSLPNAWNQFGTKIKEQLFSHSSLAAAAAVSGHTATPETTAAMTTTGTNGNASSQSSSSSSPFSSTMLFLPLQRRNTFASAQPRRNISPAVTTTTTAARTTKGIASLSFKSKFARQQRSKSMVSLPLTTNSLSSLSGPTSCPTTPVTAVSPPSSSLVPSTALVDTASPSTSTSNAMIVTTPESGFGPNLRPVKEIEGEEACERTGSTDRNVINSSASEEEMEEDDEDTGAALRSGEKIIAGHVDASSNNKNYQLIPPPSTRKTTTITTQTTITPTVTTTTKKSFKATVIGAFKLPHLFQGHTHTTTISTTSDNTTNSNNSDNNNDNIRSSRRMDRGDNGVKGGDRRGMNHVSGRNNNSAHNNTRVNNSSDGGGRFLRGHGNSNRGGAGGGGEGRRGRGSRVPQRRQWSLPSLSMSGFPSALTAA